MKQFVLMLKHSGKLLIGTRICFMDEEPNSVMPGYSIGFLEHDGWIIEHPKFKFPWFMNLHAEKYWENLGEDK